MKKFILVLLIAIITSKTLRILDDATENVDSQVKVDDSKKAAASKLSFTGKIKSYVNDICDSYDRIAQSFKITKSQSVKEVITREGFSKLKLESTVFVNKNLKGEKYDKYFQDRAKTLGLKQKYLEEFNTTIDSGKYSENADMFKTSIDYQDGRDNNTYSSINVIVGEGSRTNCYDIIIHYFSISAFQIADDLLWIEESNNYCNIFQQTKQKFITRPKTLTEKQVTALIDFYRILSLKFIGETFGIKLKLPNLS